MAMRRPAHNSEPGTPGQASTPSHVNAVHLGNCLSASATATLALGAATLWPVVVLSWFLLTL